MGALNLRKVGSLVDRRVLVCLSGHVWNEIVDIVKEKREQGEKATAMSVMRELVLLGLEAFQKNQRKRVRLRARRNQG
jgi:hypothetical protein